MLRCAWVLLVAFAPALADDADDEAKARAALTSFETLWEAAKDDAQKIAALHPLGRVPHPLVMEKLVAIASSEADPVREAAVRTMTKFIGRKELVQCLSGALDRNAGHPAVEASILRTLGESNDPAAVAVLSKWLNAAIPSRKREEARASVVAVNALQTLHLKACFEAIMAAGKHNATSPGVTGKGREDEAFYAATVSEACHAALTNFVKERFASFDEWARWWGEHSAKYDDHLKLKQ